MHFGILFAIAALAFGVAAPARAQQAAAEAVYVVSYLEVMPSAERTAVGLLRQYRDASRKDEGNLGVDVLQRIDRPHHFAIVETWKAASSFEMHKAAAPTKSLHEKLQPLRVSPYDERTHSGLAIGSTPDAPAGAAIHVVTHVDIVPPGQTEAREALKELAAASRTEEGNVRFDVLQGVRQNHFTVLETWQTQKGLEAHMMAAHTKHLREQAGRLAPNGSPYDERLYRVVK